MKKSDLFTIIKKEFARFFGDKRMLFTAIMPGILIYVLYTVMGSGFEEIYTTEDNYVYEVSVVNMPQALVSLKDLKELEITEAKADTIDKQKEAVQQELTDVLLVFPEDFDEALLTYDVTTSSGPAPNIKIYYNSASIESSEAYNTMVSILDGVERSFVNKFDICAGDEKYDLANEEDISTMVIAMLLPMLVMTFLFTGCLSAASESIAGEKERGTIATLLVTPMKRSDLALGKLISLSAIGLISALSSFLGTMLSLPKIMGGAMDNVKLAYTVSDYAVLLLVIFTTTLVIVGLISCLSALAKSVKEASTMATPLMLVVMVLSISTMMGTGAPEQWYLYLIPVYNSVQCMSGIFALEYQMIPVVLTVISNIVYSGVLVVVLTKMFNSERIMYTQ